MLRRKRSWHLVAAVCAMIAGLLVGGGRVASAAPANLTDGNDSSRKLDVSAVAVTNTPSTITYTITMDNFASSDVHRVRVEWDFDGDSVTEACLWVTQSSPTTLEGVVYDVCSGSNVIGSADSVTINGGNQLVVVVNNQVLRQAGLGSASSYPFRVLTIDSADKNEIPPPSGSFIATDIAPDSAGVTNVYATHNLGTLVCGGTVSGKVTLTENITGCRGNGLTISKAKTKINLAGFTIESTAPAQTLTPGTSIGINAGANKTVTIAGPGTIRGFGTGIVFSNSNNKKEKKYQSYIKNVTLDKNANAINISAGKYINVIGNTVTASKAGISGGLGGVGISITGSKQKLTNNNVSGSGADGIQSATGSGISFTGNTSSTNGSQPPGTPFTGDGFDVDSTKAKFKTNTASSNDGKGISAPTDATGAGNTASGNPDGDCDPAALCA